MSKAEEIGYIRVSTVEQNTGRQLDGIELDRVFTDRCSGKSKDRPQLAALLNHVREGDTVHVHDISRMARNIQDLLELIDTLKASGCKIKFHKENLTFGGKEDAMQKMMLHMLGAVYEFERDMLHERQREGIAKAKEEGKYKGRKKSIDRQRVAELLDSGVSVRKTAKELSISTTTVQSIKKELAAQYQQA